MIFEKPALASLANESDVEQKFLFPLLVSDTPSGLGHDAAEIQTKSNIRKFQIGKGSDLKTYFPDYLIARGGLPLLVGEAKAPGADLKEAYREARLYAAELNAQFPSGVQPAKRVVVTDGTVLWAGWSDTQEPKYTIPHQSIDMYSATFSEFAKEFGSAALARAYANILPSIRPTRFWKPRKMVGGVAIQREEVGMNSFGATIAADFAHIFSPLTREDRRYIAKNAYISSKRRERYVEPIDRVIRAATPPSESHSRTIEDTAAPVEIIKTFRGQIDLEHQVLLIVGSAGAGKTTFVDHLQEVALPSDVRAKTEWLRIDMNPAPISRAEIYDWLRNEIILSCRRGHPEFDFDELETIKKVHAVEVTQFRKGIGRLYQNDKNAYNAKLGEHLQQVMLNRHLMAQNHASYISSQRGKLLVIVLDNCDKRLRDEQLLMFEAAQWIQREFRGLVVLPLREETYDNHQNEPPLDTALKNLVFRIEPPLFQRILQSRVQLAMKAVTTKGAKILRYELPNGMHVDYPASDQGHYLSSILRSVFEHDMHVRRLIVGLAGRNMRRAMEIFLEFCTSGHISEDYILKMVQSKGGYVLPLGLVTTVLLRSNLRYYDSDRAYLKNVYAASELDARPSFFARLLILRWLDERGNTFGPKRLKGYAHVGDMRKDIARLGVETEVFTRALESLTRGFCIFSEDFRTTELTDEDLVALAPAGRVHLQICSDVYYFAAVAEDTWFEEEGQARAVADRMKDAVLHHAPRTMLYNAESVLAALEKERSKEMKSYAALFEDNRFEVLSNNLERAKRLIDAYRHSLLSGPWLHASAKYPPGSNHMGVISNHKSYGIFVDLEPGVTGLVHASHLGAGKQAWSFALGTQVEVQVLDLDYVERRMGLKLVPPN